MAADIRVVVADDHPLLRRGLVQVLSAEPGLAVIGEAADGAEALATIDTLRPDVVVLDIDMPQWSGLEVVREMRRLGIPGEVILLTIHDGREYLDRALSLGVKGYVLKDSVLTEITAAIRQVASGRHYISPRMSAHLLERRPGGAADGAGAAGSELDRLSPTELRVLRLVAEYRTSREIADEMHISIRTVETHRANIVTKLDLHGSHALIRFALENRDALLREPPRP